jgi:zinc protease
MIERIYKQVLSNGLTILVIARHNLPRVSTQLWYNVGSKDERSGQRGIAHFIEHMIFKGTHTLSESDINLVAQKLSGYCNAFTSHDYTGYLFDFPSQNWSESLPILADCMSNCTFKEALLNSELKAVVQELKMYRDDYVRSLIERMMGSIFVDHPYRYPIIGYKQDLWSLRREALVEFYQKYYVPNNATLVVVGDVQPDEVFTLATKYFGEIPADLSLQKHPYYHGSDLEATSLTFLRDIQQPVGVVAWEVPGVCDKKDYPLDIMSWILGSGRGARLYREIVEEQELATNLESFTYDLFDKGLFIISFEPRAGIEARAVSQAIQASVNKAIAEGISDSELVRARSKTAMDVVDLREQNQKQAYLLGKYQLALGDADYATRYIELGEQHDVKDEVLNIMRDYLRDAVRHEGYVMPLAASEQRYWSMYQDQSDEEDSRILSRITRDAEIEEGTYVNMVKAHAAQPFSFPRAEEIKLKNGLIVLLHHNPLIPTIDVIIDAEVKSYFDPEDKQGLCLFLFDLLEEGTTQYSAQAFAHEIESHGMSLSTAPGVISLKMLSEHRKKGFHLLSDMLCHATLAENSVERVRHRLISDVRNFWDTAYQCISQIMRTSVYGKDHPFHKTVLGTVESLSAISRADLLQAQKAWITPNNARVAVVGDLSQKDIVPLLEETLGTWEGPEISEPDFPKVTIPDHPPVINYPMNRDQIALAFGRISVGRLDTDFDPLLIFDQIFSGGVSGTMSSRLFDLRERSGLFYTIGGSLVSSAGQEPGMAYIKTIVSPDRRVEAELKIKEVIDHGAAGVTDDELATAKRVVCEALIDSFATNRKVAASLLFINEFEFPSDYYDHRIAQIQSVTREHIERAAQKILKSDTFTTVRVGRGL